MSLTPSVLGQSFRDAQFMLLGAGLRITPPVLVLGVNFGGQPLPMLTADNASITVDQMLDRADSQVNLLAAPAVISQTPLPATPVDAGMVSAIIALGYAVPTVRGYRPRP